MSTIWKFEVGPYYNTIIEMPIGAVIIDLKTQNNLPYLWAIVDTEAETEIRNFEVFQTGQPIVELFNATRKYIDSYSLNHGTFVFHIFEIIEK